MIPYRITTLFLLVQWLMGISMAPHDRLSQEDVFQPRVETLCSNAPSPHARNVALHCLWLLNPASNTDGTVLAAERSTDATAQPVTPYVGAPWCEGQDPYANPGPWNFEQGCWNEAVYFDSDALPGDPRTDAPPCTAHDPDKWHGAYEPEMHCHYTHTHNHYPNRAALVEIFGPVEAYTGREIGPLWETHPGLDRFFRMNDTPIHAVDPHQEYSTWLAHDAFPAPDDPNHTERTLKHEHYKYFTFIHEPDHPLYCRQDLKADKHSCITAVRFGYHAGALGAATRIHSFYIEARITRKSDGVSGIMRYGGWMDTGCLHESYKTRYMAVPGNPDDCAEQDIGGNPYRAHVPINSALRHVDRNKDNPAIWTSGPKGEPGSRNVFRGVNPLFDMQMWMLDDGVGIHTTNHEPNELPKLDVLCPNGSCRFDNSEHRIFDLRLYVPPQFDTDGDGLAQYVGFTDPTGHITNECTAPDALCVPFVLEDVPVGQAVWRVQDKGPRPGDVPIPDFDLGHPEWLKLPN